MTKPWGIYARVSTKRQADDGLSVEAQIEQMRIFAKQENRRYDVCEYKDAGKSAWHDDLTKRPAFKAMLDDARAGEITGIIVTHLDRFSRNLILTLSTLGELGKLGVGFISLENSAFDFSCPTQRLLMAVLGAFAQYYSDELSRKIKRGLESRAKKGLKTGLLPFGYCNGRCVDCKPKDGELPTCTHWGKVGKDNPIIADEHDAPGVLLAFQTYHKHGRSYDDIADVLNAAGFRSRTPRGRVLWNKHSIAELLRNITYTGVVIHQGKEIPGQHPAIISRELFDEVAVIRERRKSHQKTFNRKHRAYLFVGLLHCTGCGRVMRATTRTHKDKVRLCYHCTSRELRHVECFAQNTWVYEDAVADQFAKIITGCKLPDDWQTRISEIINSNGKPHKTENERCALVERLARLKKQFEWGDIDEQDYTAKRNELKHAIAECEPTVARMFIDAAHYLQNMTTVWERATAEEHRDMVRAIFDAVYCDPDTKRIVSLRPKPAFHFIFRRVSGLIEHDGVFDIQQEEEFASTSSQQTR